MGILLVLIFRRIDQNTLRISFCIFLFRMLAVEDHVHVQLVASLLFPSLISLLTALSAFLVVVGLIDADSGPLGSRLSLCFNALAKGLIIQFTFSSVGLKVKSHMRKGKIGRFTMFVLIIFA